MPVKSLARFQCVSKVWCNYINDPYLEIMHAKRAMKDPTMLIMVQLDRYRKYPYALLSMLVTKEEEEYAAAGGSTHDEVVITTKDPPYMEFCSKDWGSRFIVAEIILGSCKGLMISSQDHLNPPHNNNNNVDDDVNVLLVINPLKKECYKLPPIKIWSCTSLHHEREACGLGFDESTNTYKMEDLCTMVHVLGTDSSSWREIPQVPSYPISGEAVFANGCLYWRVLGASFEEGTGTITGGTSSSRRRVLGASFEEGTGTITGGTSSSRR
ncbi:uncharacterized protein [Rutidosis leptorrhynchoides]|uniref:uncharacterized protein n=1 Tax=Rutidosis leptorrhynchoides TaxID=125765 RepID=UPI003A991224